MKIKLNVLLFVFLSTSAFTQVDRDTIFFDIKWKKVNSWDEATYYRFVSNQADKYYVEDYYKSGKRQMTGYYSDSELSQKEGTFVYYYRFYEVDREVVYKKDKYHGVCTWYHKNGQKASVEKYKRGKRKKIALFNEDGTPDHETEESSHGALFPGGKQAYFDFFIENQVYPEEAIINNEQERIVVTAIIDVDGVFTKVELEEYESEALAEETLRLIAIMPIWIPAKSHNRIINQRVRLPVKFTLD